MLPIDVNEQNGQSVNLVPVVSILIFPFCSIVLLIEFPRADVRLD
jgi:hypothetical protein